MPIPWQCSVGSSFLNMFGRQYLVWNALASGTSGWFRKWWVFPPNHPHFNRVFHYKPSILGYPYSWKHPSHPRLHQEKTSRLSFFRWANCSAGTSNIINVLGVSPTHPPTNSEITNLFIFIDWPPIKPSLSTVSGPGIPPGPMSAGTFTNAFYRGIVALLDEGSLDVRHSNWRWRFMVIWWWISSYRVVLLLFSESFLNFEDSVQTHNEALPYHKRMSEFWFLWYLRGK